MAAWVPLKVRYDFNGTKGNFDDFFFFLINAVGNIHGPEGIFDSDASGTLTLMVQWVNSDAGKFNGAMGESDDDSGIDFQAASGNFDSVIMYF